MSAKHSSLIVCLLCVAVLVGVFLTLLLLNAALTASQRSTGCALHHTQCYHSNQELSASLVQLAYEHSTHAHLYSIGRSVHGQSLDVLAIALGDASRSRPDRQEVMLAANMHGDETVGRELCLRLARYLLQQLAQGNSTIEHILRLTRLHILPSINPDGFDEAEEGRCEPSALQKSTGRLNSNGQDLNRDFPRWWQPDEKSVRPRQPETQAMMHWMQQMQFAVAVNLHGGALVVNYPYDDKPYSYDARPAYSATPDDLLFRQLSLAYALHNDHMNGLSGRPCASHGSRMFDGGITNGAAWYVAHGTLQDYAYGLHGALALTIELSCCKYPAAASLPDYWRHNAQAMISLLQAVNTGVAGQTNSFEGSQQLGIRLDSVDGRSHSLVRVDNTGRYRHIAVPGIYSVQLVELTSSNSTRNLTDPATASVSHNQWTDLQL